MMSTVHELYDQADALKDAGKNDDAIEVLQQAIAADETHVLSHLLLCRIYTQSARHGEAIVHGLRACELEPQEAFNFTALSVAYQRAWAGTGDKQFITMAEDAMGQARMLGG